MIVIRKNQVRNQVRNQVKRNNKKIDFFIN